MPWGGGNISSALEVETLAVPPDVCDLRVEKAQHDSVALSWRVSDACANVDVVAACHGQESVDVLSARTLRGFRIRVAD